MKASTQPRLMPRICSISMYQLQLTCSRVSVAACLTPLISPSHASLSARQHAASDLSAAAGQSIS